MLVKNSPLVYAEEPGGWNKREEKKCIVCKKPHHSPRDLCFTCFAGKGNPAKAALRGSAVKALSVAEGEGHGQTT